MDLRCYFKAMFGENGKSISFGSLAEQRSPGSLRNPDESLMEAICRTVSSHQNGCPNPTGTLLGRYLLHRGWFEVWVRTGFWTNQLPQEVNVKA